MAARQQHSGVTYSIAYFHSPVQVQSSSAGNGTHSVESIDGHQTVDVSDVLRARHVESSTHWLLRVRLALNSCINVTYTAPQLKVFHCALGVLSLMPCPFYTVDGVAIARSW